MAEKNASHYLITAVREGDEERVREIINTYGLSFLPGWSDGYTLLRDALKYQNRDVAKLLLFRGCKTNTKRRTTETPLHFATKQCDIEIIQMLLDRGADVNAMNINYTRPIHIAVRHKQIEIVELLINFKADLNADNRFNETPLLLAIKTGSEEIARLLLKKGASARDTGTRTKTTLHCAAERGYLKIVQRLIQRGANVNSVCPKHYTPLHLAIKNGHQDVVKLLLECKSNETSIDTEFDGKTILSFAVEKGDLVIVDYILLRSPDLNNKSNRKALKVALDNCASMIVNSLLQYGFTLLPEHANNSKLLHKAIQNGYLKILEGLFKSSIDDNILRSSTSINDLMLLHLAIKYRQWEIAKLLISYGADVNARDTTGKTPILYAIENVDLETIKLLLNNEVDVEDNRKLLHLAVKQNRRDMVEVLLEHGVRVNARDKYGATALHYTVLNKHAELPRSRHDNDPDINVKEEIARLLLSRGANANARTTRDMTVLHAATYIGNVKIVEALLEYNVDVNSTDEDDKTALHLAAKYGNEVICQMLLSRGASVNAKQEDGRAALHIATQKGHEKIVEVLLKFGARVNCKSRIGTTLLHVAAEKDYLEIAKLFIKFGAKIDSQNCYGVTPLHIASKFGHIEIVKVLLDHGADITIRTRTGWTAIDFAMAGSDYFYSKCSDDSEDDCSYCVHEHILEILNCYVIQLKTAELYRKHQDLLLLNNCEEEIARLKSGRLDANVSFFNILTNGIS